MVGWHTVEQFEYRWQPTKDLSLIAGSRPESAIQPWADRIALWVRHRSAGDPTQSVRYEVFGDGMAALAWRQRNPQAVQFSDETEGRPEISRVLMGPAALLTPETATALCYMGMPGAIGPRPGQVAVGSSLSPVDPAELTGLVPANAGELDRLAMNERGLHRVIAAALTDCDKALSVQLPQRVISRPPHEGSQGLLLWGLRRIFSPLFGDNPGRRGWSFSTFEPPQGDVSTGGLADIVFRAHHTVPQALSMRQEIVVRPHDPTELSDNILYQDFARLLVDAYRHLGGDRLGQHLDAVGGDFSSLNERIEGVRVTLYRFLPAEALSLRARQDVPVAELTESEPEQVPPSGTLAPVHSAASDESHWQEGVTPQQGNYSPSSSPALSVFDSGTTVRHPELSPLPQSPAPQASVPPLSSPSLPSPVRPTPSPVPPSPSRSAETAAQPFGIPYGGWEDTPPLAPAGGQAEASQEARRYSLRGLLERLYTHPADPELESAMQDLRNGNFASEPMERAACRRLIAERDWYIPALRRRDSTQVEDMLEAVFRLAVLPDLAAPEVAAELARWVDVRAAPTKVIKALYAAAESEPRGPDRISQALHHSLGRRWLAENGIHSGPSAARSRPAHVADNQPSQASLLDHGFWRDPTTRLLTVFCVVLTVLLVLALTH